MLRSPRMLALLASLFLISIAGLVATAHAANPTATFVKVAEWSTGWEGKVTIANGPGAAVVGWNVQFDLPAGTSVSSFWNTQLTASGGHFTFRNLSWNDTIPAGTSLTFGLIGSGAGNPTNCVVNGSACTGGTASPSPNPGPTPQVPGTPGAPRVTGTTASSISLAWGASSGTVQGYRVREGNAVVATATGASAVVGNLAAGSTHTYTVTAFNNVGESPRSASISATTTAPSPQPQPPAPQPPSGSVWNKLTTFTMVNNTRGRFADSQVYWAIIGRDINTNRFVYVDRQGRFIPMTPGDNGPLVKAGQTYTNYFHTIAEARSVTIPPINSARLLLSLGGPMFIKVLIDGAGNVGYAGANIENPTDPNIDVYFDFIEMAIIPTLGIFANTTRVDSFGFPLTLRIQGLDGFDQIVGETETRDSLFAAYLAAVPNEFKSLAQPPYAPYRIVAPAHASFKTGGANGNYLSGYLNGLWSRYRTDTLTFTTQQGTFSGHVVGNTFQFTDGQGIYRINGIPTTEMALLGSGLLADPTGTTPGTPAYDKQLQIQAQICAAINRHVVETPSQWRNSAAFYPAGQRANSYAKFWHDHSIRRLAYGFAYDDVSEFSASIHTEKPTVATVTIGF